jgi:hypothetical protein
MLDGGLAKFILLKEILKQAVDYNLQNPIIFAQNI